MGSVLGCGPTLGGGSHTPHRSCWLKSHSAIRHLETQAQGPRLSPLQAVLLLCPSLFHSCLCLSVFPWGQGGECGVGVERPGGTCFENYQIYHPPPALDLVGAEGPLPRWPWGLHPTRCHQVPLLADLQRPHPRSTPVSSSSRVNPHVLPLLLEIGRPAHMAGF